MLYHGIELPEQENSNAEVALVMENHEILQLIAENEDDLKDINELIKMLKNNYKGWFLASDGIAFDLNKVQMIVFTPAKEPNEAEKKKK